MVKPRLAHTQAFRATKEYTCAACGKPIEKGRLYERYVYSVNGRLQTDRVHVKHKAYKRSA